MREFPLCFGDMESLINAVEVGEEFAHTTSYCTVVTKRHEIVAVMGGMAVPGINGSLAERRQPYLTFAQVNGLSR